MYIHYCIHELHAYANCLDWWPIIIICIILSLHCGRFLHFLNQGLPYRPIPTCTNRITWYRVGVAKLNMTREHNSNPTRNKSVLVDLSWVTLVGFVCKYVDTIMTNNLVVLRIDPPTKSDPFRIHLVNDILSGSC